MAKKLPVKTVATNIYLTEAQQAKVRRLIEEQQRKDAAALKRDSVPPMSFTEYIRFLIDQQPDPPEKK